MKRIGRSTAKPRKRTKGDVVTFIKSAPNLARVQALSLVVILAVAVGIVAIRSRAASTSPSIEPEGASLAQGAVPIDNPNASGRRAIKFTSGLTAPAAHSLLPPGTPLTPKPTIILDFSAAPSFGPWMQQVLKPMAEAWYPVFADYFAAPDYPVRSTITIKADPTLAGYANTVPATGLITFNTTAVSANFGDAAGAFMHELTHVVQYDSQASGNMPGWVVEGEADFAREHIYNDRAPRNYLPYETFMNGYSPGANFLNYIQTTYDASFVHELNVAAAKGQYNSNLFVQKTGKSLPQLWKEASGETTTYPGTITGIAGKCLDIPNYVTDNGTRIKIQTCNGSPAEDWLFGGVTSNTTTGYIRGFGSTPKCLEVLSSALTDGAVVDYWDCNGTATQQWTRQSNGTLVNVNSKKCLAAVGGSSADGTLLEQRTCNGSAAAQLWVLPPS